MRICPEMQVPVMMVPSPLMVKTLSTGSLKIPSFDLSSIPWAALYMASLRRSMFSPVVEETGMIGDPSRILPFRKSTMSSLTSSTISSSTRSFFVTATIPFVIPRSSHMSTCSRVCGMTPSSAATMSSAMSMPHAPATMWRTNFSCPGTSTMPTMRSSPNL